MHQARSCLDDIERLSETQSSAARRELLRRLTDLFLLTGNGQSEGNASVFGDVIGRIASASDDEARAELSARICNHKMMPRPLACQLAEDTISVARPVLENCTNLETEDLVRIARSKTQAHLAAIAGRTALAKDVTDILVDRGDDSVVGKVCANQGAQFSASGYRTVVNRAKDSLNITESLVGRADLPASHRTESLQNMTRAFENEVDAIGLDIQIDSLDIASIAVTIPPHPEAGFKAEIDRLYAQGDLTEEAALRFARSHDLTSAIYVMSLLSRIASRIIYGCIADGRLVPVAVLFRGLGFGRSTLREVMLLNPSPQYRSPGVLDEIGGIFASLERTTAERILRFLRLRISAGNSAEGS